MALKAVLFDLFGTLITPTLPEYEIIERFGLDLKTHPGLVRAVCGQKFENSWGKYLGKVAEAAGIENNKGNRAVVREIIDQALENGIKGVFPEAKGVLQGLKEKGYALGLVSDCYPISREILKKNGLLGFFKKEAVILSYEVGMIKWDQEIYRVCLERLGVKAEQAVMVGDSLETDIQMSKKVTNGKIQGILISAEEGEKAKGLARVVSSMAEVPRAVEELR